MKPSVVDCECRARCLCQCRGSGKSILRWSLCAWMTSACAKAEKAALSCRPAYLGYLLRQPRDKARLLQQLLRRLRRQAQTSATTAGTKPSLLRRLRGQVQTSAATSGTIPNLCGNFGDKPKLLRQLLVQHHSGPG